MEYKSRAPHKAALFLQKGAQDKYSHLAYKSEAPQKQRDFYDKGAINELQSLWGLNVAKATLFVVNKDQEIKNEKELKKNLYECYLHMNRRCSKAIYMEKTSTTVNKRKMMSGM